MSDFCDTRLGLNDAARLLNIRASELKAAILEERPLRGIALPQPMYKTGSGGWVFRAGDIMDAAERLSGKG